MYEADAPFQVEIETKRKRSKRAVPQYQSIAQYSQSKDEFLMEGK